MKPATDRQRIVDLYAMLQNLRSAAATVIEDSSPREGADLETYKSFDAMSGDLLADTEDYLLKS